MDEHGYGYGGSACLWWLWWMNRVVVMLVKVNEQ